jgi:SNF family Na+-dependent transporter
MFHFCVANFFSILLFSQGGVYLVNFLNVYGPGIAILFVVFVEAAGVFWFYGVDNFSADIEQMLGQKPGIFWRICWRYVSPTFLFVRIDNPVFVYPKNFNLFFCSDLTVHSDILSHGLR